MVWSYINVRKSVVRFFVWYVISVVSKELTDFNLASIVIHSSCSLIIYGFTDVRYSSRCCSHHSQAIISVYTEVIAKLVFD